jgi:SNF2 family DNA or RNA helicase
VEARVIGSVHRIGRDKPVFVDKPRTEGMVEKKFLALKEKKHKLADSVCDKGKSGREPLFYFLVPTLPCG